MIKIAMVEDNLKEADEIKSYLERFSKENGENLQVAHYKDAVGFLADYGTDYDIVFMDIEMPELNGMDAAKKLRKYDSEIIIIFITNMVQFAVNGYEVAAFDFIVKPVSYYSFTIKLRRALNKCRVKHKCKEEIALPSKNGVKRVAIPSIKYVEVRGHHLFFHTFDSVVQVCGNLNKFEEQLKPFNFSRCNNCYLVNLKYVSEVKADTVMVADEQLQVRRRKRKSLIDELTLYLGDN